jgi:purine-nucleoside phosphorylase
MLETINETVSFLKNTLKFSPEIGIILGSGLGSMAKQINIAGSVPFEIIPGFQATTVEGHSGKLIFGNLGDHRVIVMQGRYHFYEGQDMKQITLPVRVLKFLGVKTLFLSNASGGLNPDFEIGDIMIIEDHINMMPIPLVGPNVPSIGPRFPDMSETYDKTFIDLAEKIAIINSLHLRKGVYVAVSGPSYETPSEYKFYRSIGGDAIGMSTVPEVIVARHMGIRCFAISVICNLGIPGKSGHNTHQDVLAASEKAEPQVSFLLKSMINEL